MWSVTFLSNVWQDPTVTHTSSFVPGNWQGSAVSIASTWPSGYSKAWGKNVGDVSAIACLDGSLSSTSGVVSNGCSVAEYTKGTAPLGGTFKVCLDSTGHPVINKLGVSCTQAIDHNAVASSADSGGSGASLEEKLEGLDNVGDVEVSRSAVNLGGNNGGYTWTVTFLRDKDVSDGLGQFAGCQQKDTSNNLCNSPGDVPMFCESDVSPSVGCAGNAPDTSLLTGACDSSKIFQSEFGVFVATFDATSVVNTGTDLITLSTTSYDALKTGDKVRYAEDAGSAGGQLDALTTNTDYYVVKGASPAHRCVRLFKDLPIRVWSLRCDV